MTVRCERCGTRLPPRNPYSLHMTAAFSTAALLLYAPANLFPVMRLSMYGATSDNTVWDGCVKLYQGGDVVIALIVFLASIVVPFLKLVGLLVLVVLSARGSRRWRSGRARLYRFIEAIGRWAMLDVFVLAILVSLVRLERLASVVPGGGAAAFTAVVVLTVRASQSFDPRLIWEEAET